MNKDTRTRQESIVSKGYDEAVKNHYDNVAAVDGVSANATMADLFIRQSESEFIKQQIEEFTLQQRSEYFANGSYAIGPGKNNRFSILDIGCGNGYTLEILKERFTTFAFQGLEFNDSLREIAIQRLAAKNISVLKGDIRDRNSLPKAMVDILVCQRVLINLLDAGDQRAALNNLIEIVNSGGLLIFIEAFNSGLQNLNDARREFGLGELPPAHHNLYLEDDFFNHSDLKVFDISQAHSLSTHYFVSRVLHQTFLENSKREFTRNSHFVSFFSKAMPTGVGQYSPLRMLSYARL